jgi:alpha-ketoglutaric semialdehyde dehydrogenase
MKRFDNYIDGQWTRGSKTFENRNPANTDEVVGVFTAGDPSEVEAAASAAEAAFPAWSQLAGPARGNYLFKVADLLDQRFEQISEDMTREEGKTLPESKGEVRRSINIFRYFAGEGSRFPGMLVPSERERVHMFALRKALGVVGLITPWNFPSAIPAWKLAPALICGNTVVLKPASAAPLSAWRIVEACHDAGIPKGVVNFIAGSGGSLGSALLNAKPLKGVSFTGSTEIGHWLHGEASKRRLRIQLEMGGKNPTIVLADADFKSAVENTVNAAFFSTGQKCTATSRVIVEEAIYDRFLEALVERTRQLKVGDGMEPGIQIGPAIDQKQLETNIRYCEIGTKEAGAPVVGGRRLTGGAYDKGYFFQPTIFADVTSDMRIAQEEIFGPVLAAIRFKEPEEAVTIANGTIYGLVAAVWTKDIKLAHRLAGEIKAGSVWINTYNGFDTGSPFGGYKQSGFGRDLGSYALDQYTNVKSVWVAL